MNFVSNRMKPIGINVYRLRVYLYVFAIECLDQFMLVCIEMCTHVRLLDDALMQCELRSRAELCSDDNLPTRLAGTPVLRNGWNWTSCFFNNKDECN